MVLSWLWFISLLHLPLYQHFFFSFEFANSFSSSMSNWNCSRCFFISSHWASIAFLYTPWIWVSSVVKLAKISALHSCISDFSIALFCAINLSAFRFVNLFFVPWYNSAYLFFSLPQFPLTDCGFDIWPCFTSCFDHIIYRVCRGSYFPSISLWFPLLVALLSMIRVVFNAFAPRVLAPTSTIQFYIQKNVVLESKWV